MIEGNVTFRFLVEQQIRKTNRLGFVSNDAQSFAFHFKRFGWGQ